MSALITMLMLAAATVVMMRGTAAISTLSHRAWSGHALRFAGLSLSYALLCGGAVGVALRWHIAPELLLLGVAGVVLFDRRRGAL